MPAGHWTGVTADTKAPVPPESYLGPVPQQHAGPPHPKDGEASRGHWFLGTEENQGNPRRLGP